MASPCRPLCIPVHLNDFLGASKSLWKLEIWNSKSTGNLCAVNRVFAGGRYEVIFYYSWSEKLWSLVVACGHLTRAVRVCPGWTVGGVTLPNITTDQFGKALTFLPLAVNRQFVRQFFVHTFCSTPRLRRARRLLRVMRVTVQTSSVSSSIKRTAAALALLFPPPLAFKSRASATVSG